MINRASLLFLLVLLVNLVVFANAQESVAVIGTMDFTETLKNFNDGDTVSTDLLVCNDKDTLLGVLASMQNQTTVTNLNLEGDLLNDVAAHCWVNNNVTLSFENLDSETQMLIQVLDTPGFIQNSTIRLVNAKVSGVSLGTVQTLGDQRIALAGTYREFNQAAFFMSLESISIARQE